jgi:hypothetical protein
MSAKGEGSLLVDNARQDCSAGAFPEPHPNKGFVARLAGFRVQFKSKDSFEQRWPQ